MNNEQPRYIMRAAMWAFYTGPERQMLELFGRDEATSKSDDPSTAPSSRHVWAAMVKMALDGTVTVTEHLNGSETEQRVPLGLLSLSRPDLNKQTLTTDVGVFSGVLVQLVAIPSPAQELALSTSRPSRKGAGGPKGRDWNPFIRELVRIAVLDGHNLARKDVTARLRDWAAQQDWPEGSPPDDKTVREKVNDYWPD